MDTKHRGSCIIQQTLHNGDDDDNDDDDDDYDDDAITQEPGPTS